MEKWGSEQCKVEKQRKDINQTRGKNQKIKKHEIKANQLLLKQRMKNTQDRMDS